MMRPAGRVTRLWAILLGWHDEAFKKAAEAILAAEPEVNVALPNIAVHRARAA